MINKTVSSWTKLLWGAPRWSVLDPILFNIYINDIFFALKGTDIRNFADDTTPDVYDSDFKISTRDVRAQFWVNYCLVWSELYET